MIKYFQTTTLILLWCLLLSVIWSLVVYRFAARGKRSTPMDRRVSGMIAPALVLGPLALVVAFRVCGVNLMFPVHFFADLPTLVLAALSPALVLVLASGLFGTLLRQIRGEYAHWSAMTFALMARAVGRRPEDALRRLVLLKSMTTSWSQCLPWLFGELIIVETVFNAPGLGLDAWHLARTRDFAGLMQAVAWLVALYGLCVVATSALNHWIGRRLATYG